MSLYGNNVNKLFSYQLTVISEESLIFNFQLLCGVDYGFGEELRSQLLLF